MRVSGGYAYGEDGNLMPGEEQRMQQDQARKERPVTEPLTDPREMRKALLLAATRGDRVDGKPAGQGLSIASGLARTAHDVARFSGLSGEDLMTILAYHALRELERAHDLILRDLSTRVSAPLIVRVEPGTGKPP